VTQDRNRDTDQEPKRSQELQPAHQLSAQICEPCRQYLSQPHITLINRTKEKAEKIAGKFNLTVKDHTALNSEIQATDILIVATGALSPTITSDHITSEKELLILDLSVPKNVVDDVKHLKNVTTVHLDYLSQITDDTLEKRKTYIPDAEQIIEEVQDDFIKWLETRKFAPVIKALKQKLKTIKEEELDFHRKKSSACDLEQAAVISDRMIQKITKQFANHLKENDSDSDTSLALIQKIFQLETSSE